VRTGLPLPFFPFPPLHCRVVGDGLCVAGIEGMVGGSQLVVLDRVGVPVGNGAALPFLLTGLVVVDEGHAVATATTPEGHGLAAGLTLPDGIVDWSVDVALPADLTRVAEPLLVGGRVVVTWQAGFESSTFWAQPVGPASVGHPRRLALTDLTGDSSQAAVGGQIALARVHGPQHQLDLVWVTDDELGFTVVPLAEQVRAVAPCVAALSDREAVVAWDDRRGLCLARVPVGAVAPTAELDVPLGPLDQLQTCDVITGAGGRAAVVVHRAHPDHPDRVDGWVAALDPATWHKGVRIPLDPPGTLHHSGGWVDDRLVLVHGGQVPVISVFEVEP
jgi:hypothetical protein